MDKTLLTRILKSGVTPGKDVEGTTRAMLRFLDDGPNWVLFQNAPVEVRRTFGPAKVEFAKRCAAALGLPQYGVVGPNLEAALRTRDAFDYQADKLLIEYADALKPKLVEPNQGWSSLSRTLWEVYSMGRNAGLSDLGTYNPKSTLPGGGKSDHAVFPAMAIDFGIDPDTGWNNLKARYYVQKIAGRPEVEYVILGNRIWTRRGWGAYYSGGHMNHVHVSGNR